MARIKYTVTVRNYQFNPPSQITESEYNYYKDLIKSNPKVKLDDGFSLNPLVKILIVIGLILISPLFLLSIFIPGEAEGFMKSTINKYQANKKKNEFWNEIKSMVIKSNSYAEFSSMVRNKFNYYK
jgi:hypothetical protein